MKSAAVFIFLLFSSLSIIAPAQTTKSDEDEVIRVDTQLIDVPLIVVDKTGRPLLNLKQNNFLIYENDKRQEISNFSTTSAPFEVSLLLDTSGSTRSDLQLIQKAADSFLASLRPGDQVSIIAYKPEKGGSVRF
jgi:VWFA-related protein